MVHVNEHIYFTTGSESNYQKDERPVVQVEQQLHKLPGKKSQNVVNKPLIGQNIRPVMHDVFFYTNPGLKVQTKLSRPDLRQYTLQCLDGEIIPLLNRYRLCVRQVFMETSFICKPCEVTFMFN